jgi:ribosomal protein L21E
MSRTYAIGTTVVVVKGRFAGRRGRVVGRTGSAMVVLFLDGSGQYDLAAGSLRVADDAA